MPRRQVTTRSSTIPPAPARLPFPLVLRRLRKEHGLTQIDLAARLGVSQSLLSDIENGRRELKTRDQLSAFARAVGLRVRDQGLLEAWRRSKLPSGSLAAVTDAFWELYASKTAESGPGGAEDAPDVIPGIPISLVRETLATDPLFREYFVAKCAQCANKAQEGRDS